MEPEDLGFLKQSRGAGENIWTLGGFFLEDISQGPRHKPHPQDDYWGRYQKKWELSFNQIRGDSGVRHANTLDEVVSLVAELTLRGIIRRETTEDGK